MKIILSVIRTILISSVFTVSYAYEVTQYIPVNTNGITTLIKVNKVVPHGEPLLINRILKVEPNVHGDCGNGKLACKVVRNVADDLWDINETIEVAIIFGNRGSSSFPNQCNRTDTISDCHNKVKNYIIGTASEWSKHGNIHFKYTTNWNNSDILISFNDKSSWSVVGKSKHKNQENCQFWVWCSFGVKNPTMAFDLRIDLNGNTRGFSTGIVLHEFGHALGFQHEHQSPNLPIELVPKKVLADFPDWSPDKVYFNIIDRVGQDLSPSSKTEQMYLTAFDHESIMTYSIPLDWVTNNSRGGCTATNGINCIDQTDVLSDVDKQAMSVLYGLNRNDCGVHWTSWMDSGFRSTTTTPCPSDCKTGPQVDKQDHRTDFFTKYRYRLAYQCYSL